ncbi:MAG: hypothetical protein ACOCUR_00430, partial [Nanoarchaeota archaeon]
MDGNIWVRFVKFFSVIILTAVFTFSTLYFIFGVSDTSSYFQTGRSQSNFVTGMVPADLEEITPTYSEEDFDLEELNQYDNLIMESCEAVHYKVGDCYYLMKSILSVTSRGDPNYEDEDRFGLIPIEPSEPDITASDLRTPGKNIRYAARQIMQLYDIYSGNLAFTALAYFSTRPLANEVMYYFQ